MPKIPVVIHYLSYFFFVLHSLCCFLPMFSVFAPLMKQCENFILYLTFYNNFQSKFLKKLIKFTFFNKLK